MCNVWRDLEGVRRFGSCSIMFSFRPRGAEGPEWPERKHNAARPKPSHTHCSIGSPGPSWTPLRTPGAFVAPAATIFVSATYLLLCTQTVASVVQYGLSVNPLYHPEGPRGVLSSCGDNFRLSDLFYYYEQDVVFLSAFWATPRAP